MTEAEVSWRELGSQHGVGIRTVGSGRDLVVVPGMEGNGTSCLHVVLRVWRALDRQSPTRLLLIDYADEDHASLTALAQTMIEHVQRAGVATTYAVWGQSFGCLLAAELARRLDAERTVLVSPFTALPRSRRLGARLLAPTPRPLYRITNPPVSRWLFGPIVGPAGDAFLAALGSADPAVVARRTGWVREAATRETFGRLLERDGTSVWFGSHDRLVDLRDQIDVFTQLMTGAELPRLIPASGHVVFPAASVDFLTDRASTWLAP